MVKSSVFMAYGLYISSLNIFVQMRQQRNLVTFLNAIVNKQTSCVHA